MFFVLGRNSNKYTCFSIVFASLKAMYSSATDEYPLKNMRQIFVHGRIPSQKHGASIRPWTNTFSKAWGKFSYCGRTPSLKDGASIRTVNEYPARNAGQVVVRGRIAPVRRMDLTRIRQIYSYSCAVCNFREESNGIGRFCRLEFQRAANWPISFDQNRK